MELPSMTKSMGYESKFFDVNSLADDTVTGADLLCRMQVDHMSKINHPLLGQFQASAQPQQEKQEMSNTRIVRVIIADTNDSLPLEKRVLHMGEEKLTDLTDQELFFELPMADLLSKHNAYRVTVKNKASKDGEMLPAARIRDLKMVVIDIAKF